MSPAETTRRQWDAVVIGTGSGGKIAAQELARQGGAVLAVESERFGGECPYVACVPAKSLLASAHAGLAWADAVSHRQHLTDGSDDSGSQDSLVEASVVPWRGRAELIGSSGRAHRVRVTAPDDSESVHTAPVVAIATGSEPVIPDVDGLQNLGYWTSDAALSSDEQPDSLAILGGGAVGCELAQAFALLGTVVHLVEAGDHLLPAEEGLAGQALAGRLADDGVQIYLGQAPIRAGKSGGRCHVELPNGTIIRAERILVAGGRKPRTAGLGLQTVGVPVDDETGGLTVDRRCRVRGTGGALVSGLFAVGDVTGISSYTHSANYQAKLVAAQVSGNGHDADYSAVPRVVYTEPAVFCVGLTADQASGAGIQTRTARFPVADVERAALLQSGRPAGASVHVYGGVELILDTKREILVGAACVGPQADAWGAELALAIRARVPLPVLRDHIRAFPTWSEAITPVLDDLA